MWAIFIFLLVVIGVWLAFGRKAAGKTILFTFLAIAVAFIALLIWVLTAYPSKSPPSNSYGVQPDSGVIQTAPVNVPTDNSSPNTQPSDTAPPPPTDVTTLTAPQPFNVIASIRPGTLSSTGVDFNYSYNVDHCSINEFAMQVKYGQTPDNLNQYEDFNNNSDCATFANGLYNFSYFSSLTGLLPNTTYYYQIMVYDSYAPYEYTTSESSLQSFTTPE